MKTDISQDASGKKSALVLTACITAALIPLSIAGPAVIIPTISRSLGGSTIELNWIVNAYILTYGSTTLAAGSLADTYGRKRIWLTGLLLFACITAAIPFAPNVFWIDILRLIQGVGAAAAFAGCMASLTQIFEGYARTRIFSLIGTTFGAGAALGPFFAGSLVDTIGWQWAFWFPALTAALGSVLVAMLATETIDPHATGLDWAGAITFTTALGAFTYAIILGPEHGWLSTAVIATFSVSIGLFLAFVLIEISQARPMLDLSLFRNPRFVGVQVLAVAPAYSYVVLLVLIPAKFIGMDGHSAFEAGRLMIALSAPLLMIPFIAGILARWISINVLSGIGLLIAAGGLVWLGFSLSSSNEMSSIAPMLIIGTGIGLPWGLMDGLAVSVAPKERAGMATGIFNAVRLAGDSIALAVVGALLSSQIFYRLSVAPSTSVPLTSLVEASNRLALGDLANASRAFPYTNGDVLMEAYESALQYLLSSLGAAAAFTALILLVLLGSKNCFAESRSPDN